MRGILCKPDGTAKTAHQHGCTPLPIPEGIVTKHLRGANWRLPSFHRIRRALKLTASLGLLSHVQYQDGDAPTATTQGLVRTMSQKVICDGRNLNAAVWSAADAGKQSLEYESLANGSRAIL